MSRHIHVHLHQTPVRTFDVSVVAGKHKGDVQRWIGILKANGADIPPFVRQNSALIGGV